MNDIAYLIAAGVLFAVVVIVAILQDRAMSRENEAFDESQRV